MSDLEAASSPHAFLECWSDAIRTSSNRNGHQSQPKSAAVCVSGDSIEVLSTPSEFYETLCEEIEKSQKRISLASLYIGHAELEQKLLRTLRRKLQQQSNNVDLTDGHGSQFHLHILVDFARALRRLPQNNGHDRDPDSSEHARPDGVKQLGQASILWEHVFGHMNTADENQGNTVSAQVSLFRHPKFDTAAVLDRIPGSLKETVAVQHIKAYCFDDTVIVSGANLSHDYFTNRQDRYFVIRDAKPLADYYHGLIGNVLAPHSHSLDPTTGSVQPPCKAVKDVGEALLTWQSRWVDQCHQNAKSSRVSADTWIVPSLQLQHLGVDEDHQWTLAFLEAVKSLISRSRLTMATGYFNCPPDYCDRLMAIGSNKPESSGEGNFEVITAAPSANGFFGASGFVGLVPIIYNQYLKPFVRRLEDSNIRGEVCEYERAGWTFHAKGMWVSQKRNAEKADMPHLSVVGSSNFGYRSVVRDLESQLFIGTTNMKLQRALARERDNLLQHCVRKVDQERVFLHPERRLRPTFSLSNGAWIRPASWLLRKFF